MMEAPSKPSLLRRLLESIAGEHANDRQRLAARDARRAIALCHALLSERGDVSGARVAREALAAYGRLNEAAPEIFFDMLAEQFSPDPRQVGRVADEYREDPSQWNLIRLQRAVEAPRQELFRRLNMVSGGIVALLQMRRQVLAKLHEQSDWAGIEADLLHLFASWFNRGFLVLQRIDWNAPALVLEKLIQYEAVHPVQGWADLRRRLQADRRCYAFFHPVLPDEPVIFIEVALTKGVSTRVQPLLDPSSVITDPAAADCAIFYSITNCQEGLRGVSFGNLLIKQVAEHLGREFPRLKTFATLSPIPGFRRWLTESAVRIPALGELVSRIDAPGWLDDEIRAADMHRELVRLCAHYLLYAKQGREPLDPVQRFHLGNGARLERLNWLSDVSPTGMQRSVGLMANYVYRLDEVERNHEAYAKEGRIAVARRFEVLARESLIARSETVLVNAAPAPTPRWLSGEPVRTSPAGSL
ncbi:MAG: malonyl-CoA decarboxylase [Burkholderiaceae bacterium]|nr:malonyl-CoA decarboxylase [Burkholderiaceae bacterium]